jgi:hypothetical protein
MKKDILFMDAIYEMIIIIGMIIFWIVELFTGLLARDFIIIFLSFLLLVMWFDELFPFKKDLRFGFNRKLFLTVLIVLFQHILRLLV